ncbi:MAG: 6,7-dimethyl-8-ribityllumazine synthase [Bacteroidales bacterium]
MYNPLFNNSEGLPSAEPFRFVILVSEWNPEITKALLDGAYQTLIQQGAHEDNIVIKWVPGSFELAAAASLVIDTLQPDAVICLGCVIQGETRHFEFICQAVAQGISNLSMDTLTPVSFGVLTTDNVDQAKARAGGDKGNKGIEAAAAALKMAAFRNELMSPE